MTSNVSVDSAAVLDDLVRQFSDPMAFFRELIQNAIDAGSGEVEIRLDFQAGEAESGMLVARVDDFGEGMTREIIETKLTRLFSSAKDNDYTKIGRFGIGFVSVFAIAPDAVCLDTGRTGEAWRVLFHPDRTYDLIALDHPVEGTQIQIFKRMSEAEFARFQARTREVVSRWCKHVSAPIWVDGAQINEAFTLDAPCVARFEQEGTRIVAGLVEASEVMAGYYNRGLTLKEEASSPWPHVAIKIDSRYLEHTLTRDQVLQDRHYHKAMRLMREVVEAQLPREHLAALAEAALHHEADPARYEALAARWVEAMAGLGGWREQRDRLALFPAHGRAPVSLHQCQALASGDALWLTYGAPHLLTKLPERALAIALSPEHGGARLLCAGLNREALPVLEHTWVMPAPYAHAHSAASQALTLGLAALLARLRDTPREVVLGRLDYPGSPCAEAPAMLCAHAEAWTRAEDARATSRASLLGAPVIVLNAAHHAVEALLQVVTREPEWAAYMMAKLLLIRDALSPQDDDLLMASAIAQREARLT